jgi:hypothetical protein
MLCCEDPLERCSNRRRCLTKVQQLGTGDEVVYNTKIVFMKIFVYVLFLSRIVFGLVAWIMITLVKGKGADSE